MRSRAAAKREALTTHDLEQLLNGVKAYIEFVNLHGGIYHLTADEVYWEDDRLVLQEPMNTSNACMPSLIDIQDGLFRNILSYVIDELYLHDQQIEFTTRLKITGKTVGSLKLPVDCSTAPKRFVYANGLSPARRLLLCLVQRKVTVNPGFTIEIAPNS